MPGDALALVAQIDDSIEALGLLMQRLPRKIADRKWEDISAAKLQAEKLLTALDALLNSAGANSQSSASGRS